MDGYFYIVLNIAEHAYTSEEIVVGKKILQINLKYKVSASEISEAFMELAQPIADVNGLEWKTWIHNEEEKSAGGIYLFKDEETVKNYLESDIVSGIMSNPALSDIDAKVFDVLTEHSKVTRAPI